MTKAAWRQEILAFTTALVQMKDQAGRLGLWRTMHAMDTAARLLGYEHADILVGKQAPGWGQTPFTTPKTRRKR